MPGQIGSRTVSLLIASLVLLSFSSTAAAQIRFDLPAQPLAQALTTLGSLTSLNIYFDARTVDGIKAPALKAELSADDALRRLLAGTHLRAVRVDDNTIRVVDDTVSSKHAQGSHDPPTGAAYPAAAPSPPVRLAYAGGGSATAADSEDSNLSTSNPASRKDIQEVVVSAQKRTERLQDVPVPVSVINTQVLTESNQLRLQDYYTAAPGLNVTTDDFGTPQVTIRGLTTGAYTNPTVGVVVDDVPYGSSSALAYGQQAPDFDPSDLLRVEVLRGPQGTLYGANTMGGLLKYVTVDPSPEAFSGRLEGGGTAVHNGVNLGYSARGAANIPLSDTLAVRVSGFTRKDPGYVDNIQTGQRGVNSAEVSGGRLSALWQPSPGLTLKLSALIQHTKIDGSSSIDVEPGLGDLQQSDVRNTGWYKSTLQAYSFTLTDHLGALDLTAVTGYNVTRISESFDYTATFGPYTESGIPGTGFDGFGVQGTPLINYQTVKKFTQEIRLSGLIGSHIDWLVGGFYDHEDSPGTADLLAAEPTSGEIVGMWSHGILPSSYAEYAAFADLTFHFTDRFDIQIGGRESQNRQTNGPIIDTGIYDLVFLGMPSPIVFPEKRSKDNSFTYLLTPRFKISPDWMVYARLASGYRPGGTNSSLATVNLPPTYRPDRTYNYEIGLKGDALDHQLSFDASVYYIDWRQIQLQLFDPDSGLGYVANGSRAKSEGIELSVESHPLQGLSLSAWVSWDNAVLTEAFPPTSLAYGVAGDRLPYSSRFSGSVSAEQTFPITHSVVGFVGGVMSYVGAREGIFLSAPPRQTFPSYARTDLRGGIRVDPWTVNLFINNLTDRRAQLSGGLGTFNPVAFQYIQPRTIGVAISRKF